MTRTRVILIASTASLVVLAFLTLNGFGPVWLRGLLAVPLITILPGYALLIAIRPSWHPGGVERLTISIGLSLSLTVLVGMVLALSPWHLSGIGWVISLGTITLAANTVALQVAHDEPGSRWRPRLVPSLLVAVMVVGAFVLGAHVVKTGGVQPYNNDIVQFSIGTKAKTYDGTVLLEIDNLLSNSTHFRLRVAQGAEVATDTVVQVDPGKRMYVTIPPIKGTNRQQRIEAMLTPIDGNARPRSVWLWLPATK